jgi:hypothetical protein
MEQRNAYMTGLRRGSNRWKLLLSAAIFAVALIFWLEWLGSEKQQTVTEIPIAAPDARTKTGSNIDK